MATQKPNDMPAFPVPGNPATCPCMTLRDYFAGVAMTIAPLVCELEPGTGPALEERIRLCERIYEWADAMLIAREKQGGADAPAA